MRKIDKFLAKLGPERRKKALAILVQVKAGDFEGLNLKKLKGFDSLYRVRIGQLRIIFEMDTRGIRIADINFRSEDTYKDL